MNIVDSNKPLLGICYAHNDGSGSRSPSFTVYCPKGFTSTASVKIQWIAIGAKAQPDSARELGDTHEDTASDPSIAPVIPGRDSDDITFCHEHRRLEPRERGRAAAFGTTEQSAIEINFAVLFKGTSHVYGHEAYVVGGDCSSGCA